MALLVVVVEADAERSPERVEHRLYRFIREIVAVGIHQHDIGLHGLTCLGSFYGDRSDTILTDRSMAVIRLVPPRVVVMVITIVELLTLHVRYLKLTTTTTRVEPFIDLLLGGEETIDVGVFLLFIVLTMGGEETQVTHVLNLQQFGVIPRYTEIVKKTVEEIEHIEADARLLTVCLQYPIGPVVVWA